VTRGISPTLAAPLLLGITVALAAVLGVMTADFGAPSWEEPRVLSATATDDGSIAVRHESGPRIDITRASVVITVDGDPLAYQPPVPFAGAKGFLGAPTGAFNPSAEPQLTPGDRATLVVAGTNAPPLESGDEVRIEFVADETTIAVVETTVDDG